MLGGTFLMFLFFVLLFLAALTSLISIYEASVSMMMDKFNISRVRATVVSAIVNLLGMIILLSSFTKMLPLQIWDKDLFSVTDIITTSYTMPLVTLICCLFMGWKASTVIIRNISQGSNKPVSRFFKRYLRFTLRLTAPIILITLFILGLF
jgi:NSS family neurotransmitter:Na+ symporter